jgi:hypothetical protein
MPVHDWSRVEAAIFHHFHHAWIEELSRTLNAGILPPDYYALSEQHAAGYGPDVLTLQTASPDDTLDGADRGEGWRESPDTAAAESGVSVLVAPPKVQLTAETDMEFYRRKQNAVVVRHVSGDQVVAMVEIVSPGNKSGRRAFRAFVEKSAALLDQGVHLLIIDLHPPTPRDPQGVHGAIWEDVSGQEYAAPADKPLTLVAYDSALALRAYIEPFAVGDVLRDMPLFLEPGAHVLVPLESTYQSAFAALPRRWRAVLEEVR